MSRHPHNGGKGPPPLRALARAVVGELLKEEVRDRCMRLEKEPLGYLIKAGIARDRAIKAQGREWTEDDLSEFLDDVPDIVAFARQNEREGEGGGSF